MKYLTIIFVLLLGFQITGYTQNGGNIKIIGVEEFKSKVNSGNFVNIDLRTKREYDEGHIKNSINIDFYDKGFLINIQNYSGKSYLMYSRDQNISDLAIKKIEGLNHKEIFILENGLVSWKREGLELVK
ncbi:MAG: rhodanese-like domain-containing protein [Saprospiraceae bacterium]